MRDTDRTADHIGDGENFKNLIARDAQLVAFTEVVFDTVVAAQHHGGNEAQHFFGFYIERAFLIGLVIEAPETFDDLVVVGQNALVHAGAVVVEFFYN